MVLNRAALDLIQDTRRLAEGIVSHDWWVYQLVSGAGGVVIYDPEPCLLYRQHDANQVGANDTLAASLSRLLALFQGRYRDWNHANAAALDRARHWLTPQACGKLEAFDRARNGTVRQRLRALYASGVYRQTLRGTIALWLAAAMKRL